MDENRRQKKDVVKTQLPVAMKPYSGSEKTFHFLFYVLKIESHQKMTHLRPDLHFLFSVGSNKTHHYKLEEGRESEKNIHNDCYALTCCQCTSGPDYTSTGL